MFDGETTPETLYRTENGTLGTDATNPSWIASGRAVPCEYGIYPLEDALVYAWEMYDEYDDVDLLSDEYDDLLNSIV